MCVISTILTLSTTLATTIGMSLLGGTAATAAATGAAATAATATAAGTAAAASGTAAAASAAVAGAAAATGAAATAGTAATLSSTASVLGFAAMATAELAVAGSVASGAVGTVAGVQQAEAQKAQAEYMAEVEAENSRIAAKHAEAIKLQGNQEKLATYNKMMQTKGTGRAQYAAGNVVLGSGTPNDYEADIADAYDLDMRNLDYDIASRSWQSKVQAVSSANQAANYRAQAEAYGRQKTGSLLSGSIGTLFKGADSVSGVVKLFK